jgi:hypothetical protein
MLMMKRTIMFGVALAALVAATPAFATGFDANFVISIGGNTYTFSLPDSPTVASTGSDDFSVSGVEISKNGGAPVSETVLFTEDQQPPAFGDGGVASFSGAYQFDLVNPNQVGYPALFIGSLSDPTFVAGVYTVQEDDPDTVKGTVTIYTPEPGTLALFGMGLLCLAGVMRRKLSIQ